MEWTALSSSCLPSGDPITYEPLAAEPLQISFSEMVCSFAFVITAVAYACSRFNVFWVCIDLRLIVVDALS